MFSQAWWSLPKILAAWEAEAGDRRMESWRPAWVRLVRLCHKNKMTRDVAKVEEDLLSKTEALGSNLKYCNQKLFCT
jgi:hypothetical protein